MSNVHNQGFEYLNIYHKFFSSYKIMGGPGIRRESGKTTLSKVISRRQLFMTRPASLNG
jgi:hypothetical protein